MIQAFFSIAGILITILFVVGTHEYAHFMTARLLGIKVLRFSIGFGKRLFHFYDKQGTEYVFALIPLGGYVKMLDENEGDVAPKERHRAFNQQPYYKKLLVVIAGPVMNIFCAFVLYWLIFVIGFNAVKPIIGTVAPQSIASQAGLKSNQEIISIDDKTTSSWTGVLLRMIVHAGNQDQLKMQVKDPGSDKIDTHYLNLHDWQMSGLSPDPLSSIGITPYMPNIPLIIKLIKPDSPAAAQLQLNDEILALNKKPVKDWEELVTYVSKHPEENVVFTLKRHDQIIDVPVQIGSQRSFLLEKSGYLGMGPSFSWPKEFLKRIQFSPLAAIPRAWQEITDFTYLNLLFFAKMITGKLSIQSLGGPITIFESAGTALNYGFLAFMGFLAFLSISIGVINLLPVPGLDGGHIFIQTVEFIIRRPIPEKALIVLYKIGFVLILFVLIQALANDIMRL